jgi:hypothetical protein
MVPVPVAVAVLLLVVGLAQKLFQGVSTGTAIAVGLLIALGIGRLRRSRWLLKVEAAERECLLRIDGDTPHVALVRSRLP